MDPQTGDIYEGTEDELKEIEKQLERSLIPVKSEDLGVVKSMPLNEKRAYAKKVEARRKRRKAQKLSRRKNRKK